MKNVHLPSWRQIRELRLAVKQGALDSESFETLLGIQTFTDEELQELALNNKTKEINVKTDKENPVGFNVDLIGEVLTSDEEEHYL